MLGFLIPLPKTQNLARTHTKTYGTLHAPEAEGAEEREQQQAAVCQKALPRPARAQLVDGARRDHVHRRGVPTVPCAEAEGQVGQAVRSIRC